MRANRIKNLQLITIETLTKIASSYPPDAAAVAMLNDVQTYRQKGYEVSVGYEPSGNIIMAAHKPITLKRNHE
jgi:hypothetical protein